jgi:hypothetical protein
MRIGVRQSSAFDPADGMTPAVATIFGDFVKDAGDWGLSFGSNAASTSGSVSYAGNSLWVGPTNLNFSSNAEGQMQFSANGGPTWGVATLVCADSGGGRRDRNQAAFTSNPVTGALTYGQFRIGYGSVSMEFRVKGNAAAVNENYRMVCGLARVHALGASFPQDDAVCWRKFASGQWEAVVSRGYDNGSGSHETIETAHRHPLSAGEFQTLGIEISDDAGRIDFLANGAVVKTFHRSEYPNSMPDSTSVYKMNFYCGIMEGTGCTTEGRMEVDYASARIRLRRGGR